MARNRSSVGAKINTLMSLMEVSQAEVSQRGQVDRSNLNRYLRDRSDIRTDSFIKVLRVLGLDIDILLNREIRSRLGDGVRHRDQIGRDMEKILLALDPIAIKTIVETLMVKGRGAGKPEILTCLENLAHFKAGISTTGRGF